MPTPCNSVARVRDVVPDDHAALLRLNEASVEVLSPLNAAALADLLDEADLARVAVVDGEVRAFVIALREAARYASVNYRWFAARHERFLYVDRVVVDAACRGRGIGASLYADVFKRAAAKAVPIVACEYDLEPPNPASARFHAAQGFGESGRQTLAGGKQVSMQIAAVPRRAGVVGSGPAR